MSKAEAKEFVVAVARVFAFAFVGVFTAGVSGVWLAPDFAAKKAATIALVSASVAAGARAVYGAVRSGQIPFPKFGV